MAMSYWYREVRDKIPSCAGATTLPFGVEGDGKSRISENVHCYRSLAMLITASRQICDAFSQRNSSYFK